MNSHLAALIPIDGSPVAAPPRISPVVLYTEYFRGAHRLTRVKYEYAWKLLAKHNQMTVEQSVEAILTQGPQNAKMMVWVFRNVLIESGRGPSQVNALLSGITAIIDFANNLGLIHWKVEMPRPKREAYRDTRGPERETIEKGFRKLGRDVTMTGLRNHAMVRLLYNPALRAHEVVSLDLQHYRDHELFIFGKARKERQWVTLSDATDAAIRAWLQVRPHCDDSALFVTCQQGYVSKRVVYHRLADIVEKRMKCTPHQLRHAGITHALDMSNGNVRAVQRFSRHSNPATVLIYDDNRRDLAGQVANLIDVPMEERVVPVEDDEVVGLS